jgi:hypothetical protein
LQDTGQGYLGKVAVQFAKPSTTKATKVHEGNYLVELCLWRTRLQCAVPHIAYLEHSSKDQLCYKKFAFIAITLKGGLRQMQGDEKKERWRELCEKISVEQDTRKLQALIAELSRVLDERHERLRATVPDPKPPA